MRRFAILLFVLCAVPVLSGFEAPGVTLRGSRASMERQNRIATAYEFEFLRSAADVIGAAARGELVAVEGNEDYGVLKMTFPFTRPEVLTFIERLARQYRAGCGERLIVTSLTRPLDRQPSNASPLSVHPAGMAIDLRVSQNARCRTWIESTLLSLEANGLLDATREHNPPHYHVALFPGPYMRHVANLERADSVRLAAARAKQDSLEFAARLAATAEQGELLAHTMEAGLIDPPSAGSSRRGLRIGGVLGILAFAPLAVLRIRRRTSRRGEAQDEPDSLQTGA